MSLYSFLFFFFFFNDTATTEIYTLSLHDALPICPLSSDGTRWRHSALPFFILLSFFPNALDPVCVLLLKRIDRQGIFPLSIVYPMRSEEHTSELQSHSDLVCRLLLEKKKNKYAYLQVTSRRCLNEWEDFKKVIRRCSIGRRITIPLTLSNLTLLRRIISTYASLDSRV